MNVERSIHKGDYKMILYPKVKRILLFNLGSDPLEMSDIANKPGSRKALLQLFSDLIQLQQSLQDKLDLTSWYNELRSKN